MKKTKHVKAKSSTVKHKIRTTVKKSSSVVAQSPTEIKHELDVRSEAIKRGLSMREAREKGSPVAKIKVVGVGGGGGNAISRMHEYFPRSVDLIAINTDLQDLEECEARKKIYIGRQTTKGLGAGMNPELGKQAAEENRDEIAAALAGADMVFITAGFGGGTGSGATPVVAEIAQELGILTAAIVTKPFTFEGTQRSQIAQEALLRLKDRVDTYITISNDKIFSVIDKDTSLRKAFEAIDEVLKNAVLGVTELIMSPGIINVDFADIRTIVQNSGASIIGVGIGSGKDRAVAAARAALQSPLLETAIDGARGVLFSISGHKDIKMSEINDVAKMISENIDPNARIIFGTYYDRRLDKGDLKVTLIATGFGAAFGKSSSLFGDFDSFSQASRDQYPIAELERSASEHSQKFSAPRTNHLFDRLDESFPSKHEEPSVILETPIVEKEPDVETEESEDDMWDIPAFLRKKGKKK